MVTDGEILQANATIITGILIFLTLAPISKMPITQIVEKKITIRSLFIILALLVVSTFAALFPFPNEPYLSFYIARLFLMSAVSLVAGLIGALSLYYPKIEKQQKPKGQDQG